MVRDLEPRAHRNIAFRDLLNEVCVRVVEHNMEMLHGVYRFQRTPILEPDDLDGFSSSSIPRNGTTREKEVNTYVLWRYPRSKGLINVFINLSPHSRCQIVLLLVVLKLKFCPDNEMDNFLVDTIGPVIVEDRDVILIYYSNTENPNGERIYSPGSSKGAALGFISVHLRRF